jgi:hypothetical protein
MNTTSLIIWLSLATVLSLAAIVFVIRSEHMAEFSAARRFFGGLLVVFALFLVLLPVLFVPSIGIGGALALIGAVALMIVISAWKWWVLWIPWP